MKFVRSRLLGSHFGPVVVVVGGKFVADGRREFFWRDRLGMEFLLAAPVADLGLRTSLSLSAFDADDGGEGYGDDEDDDDGDGYGRGHGAR